MWPGRLTSVLFEDVVWRVANDYIEPTSRHDGRELCIPVKGIDPLPILFKECVLNVGADQRVAALDVVAQVGQGPLVEEPQLAVQRLVRSRLPALSAAARAWSPPRPAGRYPRRRCCSAGCACARRWSAAMPPVSLVDSPCVLLAGRRRRTSRGASRAGIDMRRAGTSRSRRPDRAPSASAPASAFCPPAACRPCARTM